MAKGKGAKKKKPPAAPHEDPEVFLRNYHTLCRYYGCKPMNQVLEEIVKGGNDQLLLTGPLTEYDVAAIVGSVLGSTSSLSTRPKIELNQNSYGEPSLDGPFTKLTAMRCIDSQMDVKGIALLSLLLQPSLVQLPESTKVTSALYFLQLVSSEITAESMTSIAKTLPLGANALLQGLILDHSYSLGVVGATVLFQYLKTNKSLKKLSLAYCGIDCVDVCSSSEEKVSAFVQSLKTFLEFQFLQISNQAVSGVEELCLKGNKLGPRGLATICRGLQKNNVLKKIDLSDNFIGPDVATLSLFADAMTMNKVIASVDLSSNSIGKKGAEVLVSSGVFCEIPEELRMNEDEPDRAITPAKNTTITQLKIDSEDIPSEWFKLLCRKPAVGKKGKKKKKGKK